MSRGLEVWQASGAAAFRPHCLGLLGQACGKAGQVHEGLQQVAEALAEIEDTAERWYEAELHRVREESLLRNGADPVAAAACFEHAI